MKKIFTLILTLSLVLTLVACGEPTPKDTVESFLSSAKTWNVEEMEAACLGEVNGMAAESFDISESTFNLMKKLILDFDYEIGEEKIDGDKATVSVKVTTHDLGSAITSTVTEVYKSAFALMMSDPSDEEFDNMMENMLKNELNKVSGTKAFTTTVEIPLEKVDGEWKISNDTEEESDLILNAITGGMLDALDGIS